MVVPPVVALRTTELFTSPIFVTEPPDTVIESYVNEVTLGVDVVAIVTDGAGCVCTCVSADPRALVSPMNLYNVPGMAANGSPLVYVNHEVPPELPDL